MKKFKVIIISALAMLMIGFTSCYDAGTSREILNGDEDSLPTELKGLKVYSVSVGEGDFIKVAVLDNKINSTTYRVSKLQESTVILNTQNNQLIQISEILIENDSIIVCRK